MTANAIRQDHIHNLCELIGDFTIPQTQREKIQNAIAFLRECVFLNFKEVSDHVPDTTRAVLVRTIDGTYYTATYHGHGGWFDYRSNKRLHRPVIEWSDLPRGQDHGA